MVCGCVFVPFRLRALFASGVGSSLETSSSSCVDDDDVAIHLALRSSIFQLVGFLTLQMFGY
jgi:hypothetical protein